MSDARISETSGSYRHNLSIALGAVSCAVALAACGSSGQPAAATSSGYTQRLKFADCMRSHGVPNFPDPTLSAPSGAHLVLALRGMVFAIGPGVSPQSPAFARSAAACGLKLP